MAILSLEARDFKSDREWRWVLKDARGSFLADHPVNLDPADPKYGALFNLPDYLHHYASPDQRERDETQLLEELGAWIGKEVLGAKLGETILASAASPLTIRVSVPPEAERLLLMPLDIAHARGRALVMSGARMVFEVRGDAPPPAVPVGERLRLLALFSLPPAGSPLNLRRERQMLRNLVRRLTGASGLAADLRVLQYGVTRESLSEALEDGEGWDIIHFSGHGQPGTLVLETVEGRPDLITSAETAELLRLSAHRLKLVLLSSCLSAAAGIQSTLSRLGEAPPGAEQDENSHASNAQPASESKPAPAMARMLCASLDCAVLAMRYAVDDEFAIALGASVYENLLLKNQPLPKAVERALVRVLDSAGVTRPEVAPLSIATPALFGARGLDLRLSPPAGGGRLPSSKLAYFPDEPAHFVGRVGAMTRGSTTLAPESGKSGVLFYGMAGAGKTSCAVELAYHHAAARRFQAFIWYEAPAMGSDIALALRDFARSIERELPELEMVHLLDQTEKFVGWLPRLTEVLEQFAVLLVLDNLESLLTDAGEWRDERWGFLMESLLKPGGLSRVILTSRTRPTKLSAVEIIPVHALPLDEAILLVRELPNLGKLLRGGPDERDLVRRTLRLVQGHPKLIQLAEALAAEPDRLGAQLERAEAVQGEGELDAFFRNGETRYDQREFTRTLHDWTNGIAAAIPDAAQVFFQFLCAIEEEDRVHFVLEVNWQDVWRRLDRPAPAPPLTDALAPLLSAGLVDEETLESGDAFKIIIHPGVAEAGRAAAGPDFQTIVDQELAVTWVTLMNQAQEKYGKEPHAGSVIIRAGLAAFPYLARREQWGAAGEMLDQVSYIEHSPATIAALLPRVRRVAEATAGGQYSLQARRLLARLLSWAGRTAEAETMARAVEEEAVERGEFDVASATLGDLVNMLWGTGRLAPALELAEKKAEIARRAGAGPWTQFADKARPLQILNQMGQSAEVLKRVAILREEMKDLPDPAGQKEFVPVWNVRETLLDCGRSAALAQADWQAALDFAEEISASEAERNASALERAKTLFNNYGPLLRLDRVSEARKLLVYCRAVFEQENDLRGQGKVLSAIADLEDKEGRPASARKFEYAALRFKYIVGDPVPVAISQYNLANYIARVGNDPQEMVAHRLASLLIFISIESGEVGTNLRRLHSDLHRVGAKNLPADYNTLCEILERTEGVRFREMFEKLTGGADCDQLLASIVAVVGKDDDTAPA